MKNHTIYQTPIDKLLTLGDCHKITNEYNYIAELGLDTEHIPGLISMAIDQNLNSADSASLEAWGAIHACRALGQLRAEAAIEPLMQLFHKLEDSDWVNEEMPKIYGMFGEVAIPRLQAYLADESHGIFPRITAIHSLEEICKQHPNTRQKCIAALTQQLKSFAQNPHELNGFIVASLIELQAVESAAVIKSAFLAQSVPDEITGTWDNVCDSLGINSDKIALFTDINLDEVSQLGDISTDEMTQTQEIADSKETQLQDVITDEVTQLEDVSQTQEISFEKKQPDQITTDELENLAITSDDLQLIEDVTMDVEQLHKVETKTDEQKQSSDIDNRETEATQLKSEVDNQTVTASVKQPLSKGFGGFATSQGKAKTNKKKKR
ncbi:hypothetical protein NIES592_10590 [Fischerella major NIES-592]|uniref:HEAT repeat domain-containing protein n=2 Tax=Fischerella TaxID=1190 RepID=A0A1U7H0W8_9CYAN|nr:MULTISPECIES: HEAT repeat domain-containing protein [Fischerella]OKH14486.1 hypothetical protein NIES592_10590 [Fischerella major NIES-592]PMB46782.1 HEAT repeat domain-containing protein [Fischerella thermalis CCMEE 5330]